MKPTSSRRRRLPREERERHILDEAVRFFAEVGFEGQTRVLAERLGVTQPLLYRYFPDKEALIERVFEEVYRQRWEPEWGILLQDRTRPLLDRLAEFYRCYCHAVLEPQWIRILMFSGLKGEDVTARHLTAIRSNMLEPICGELRHEFGLPPRSVLPIDDAEIDFAWMLHSAILAIPVRKWVFHLALPEDVDSLIECTVATFLRGSAETYRRLIGRRLAKPVICTAELAS